MELGIRHSMLSIAPVFQATMTGGINIPISEGSSRLSSYPPARCRVKGLWGWKGASVLSHMRVTVLARAPLKSWGCKREEIRMRFLRA